MTFGVDFVEIVLKAILGDETHLLGSGKLCKSQLFDGFAKFSLRSILGNEIDPGRQWE